MQLTVWGRERGWQDLVAVACSEECFRLCFKLLIMKVKNIGLQQSHRIDLIQEIGDLQNKDLFSNLIGNGTTCIYWLLLKLCLE